MARDAGYARMTGEVGFRISELFHVYAPFLGSAKAKYPAYVPILEKMDSDARSYFQALPQTKWTGDSYALIGLGMQKIKEIVSFIETLDTEKPRETVSRKLHDKIVQENLRSKEIIKMLIESRGFAKLNELLQKFQESGINIDENWVMAVCALNLLEAAVNKKLEDLDESTEGSFTEKLSRLVATVKHIEEREIQRMLPESLYKGPRQKLDHASHKYKPTPREAENIVRTVISFLDELFPESPTVKES